MTSQHPSLDQLLCFTVYSASHAFNRIYKPLLDKLNLTYPQYLVMLALWSKDDQTVGDLSHQLLLESSTLTPLLKRLEAQGYVIRQRDKNDERQVRILLTAAGRKLAHSARNVPKCIQDASGLTAEGMLKLQSELAAMRMKLLAASGKP